MIENKLVELPPIRQIKDITTLGRALIYCFIAAERFPKSVHLSPNRRAWRLSEVLEWNESPLDWGRDPFFDA